MTAKNLPTFFNPFWQENFPDPFVLKVRGRYYAYATDEKREPLAHEQVFPILASDDLVHWRKVGKAMQAFGPPYHSYWAPEVTEYNGRFYLYYAVHNTDEFRGAIRVAVAEQPEGPFRDSGHDLTSALVPWAIDPHIFRDTDGQWYLFMTIEYLQDPSGYVGSGNAGVRLRDPFTVDGSLTRVTAPGHAWQLFEAKRQSKGGIDWYTVEGPAVLRHRNRYYELYSGGCYFRDNYAVSYATSAAPLGPAGMQDTSWQDWPGNQQQEVLLRGVRDKVLGPGHNSVVLGPNNVDLYMAYHAWPPDMSARQPFLDRLFWHGKELWTPAPGYLPQPMPAQPALRELFTSPELDMSWQSLQGDWVLAAGEVVQRASDSGVLLQRRSLSSSWLLEVHLRYLEGKGKYGVLLRGQEDYSITLSSSEEGHPVIAVAPAATEQPSHHIPLQVDFTLKSYHRLLLHYSGSLLRLLLDGQALLELSVPHAPEQFALYTEECSAAFTGVTLTHAFRDEFLETGQCPVSLGWQVASSSSAQLANWQIRAGALVQASTSRDRHLLLKGDPQHFCEFGVTARIAETATGDEAAYGLALVADQQQVDICLLRSGSGWLLEVKETTSTDQSLSSVKLPATFSGTQWHTLRLILRERWLDVYLDGVQHCKALALSAQDYRCGLLTQNTAVAFIGAWETSFML